MIFIKKLIDLILYGNYWIAACALTMLWQTQMFFGISIQWSILTGFTFFSTFFLYAVHRIVGIARLKDFFEVDRYQVIARFKSHIFVYALVAGIASLYYFIFLPRALQWSLIIPAILSLGYVIPFLGNRKRLRDLNHIKIYLIAIVWAWVTVFLPAMEVNLALEIPTMLMAVERALFIFAITLPFDIRDLVVDKHSGVKTIPSVIGLQKTKRLGYATILIFCLLVLANFYLGIYQLSDCIALIVSGLSTLYIIQISEQKKHDYFYSGLVDGTMLIQFGLVGLGRCLF